MICCIACFESVVPQGEREIPARKMGTTKVKITGLLP